MMLYLQEGKDGMLQTTSEEKRYLTKEEILKRVWTDGIFEFVFTVMVADQIGNESMNLVMFKEALVLFLLLPHSVNLMEQ